MKDLIKSLMCAFGVILLTVFPLSAEVTPEYLKAQTKGAVTNARIKIVDDDDSPIADAAVNVLMGMLDPAQSHWIHGVTDTNGVFVLEGKTCGNEIIITISKDGYYDSNRTLCYVDMRARHAVTDGKWLPWGKEERIVLRKIRNQKSMVKCSDVFTIPTTNKWLGFDLALKDWTSPYGKGRIPDLEAYLTWDGKPPILSKFVRLDVRFPGVFSGCYFVDKIGESKFKGVYSAVTNGCYGVGELAFYSDIREGRHDVKEFDFSKVLVTRTRCKLDEAGNVVCANYSTIRAIQVNVCWDGHGEMTLRYYYNPTTNDTNLEPKR